MTNPAQRLQNSLAPMTASLRGSWPLGVSAVPVAPPRRHALTAAADGFEMVALTESMRLARPDPAASEDGFVGEPEGLSKTTPIDVAAGTCHLVLRTCLADRAARRIRQSPIERLGHAALNLVGAAAAGVYIVDSIDAATQGSLEHADLCKQGAALGLAWHLARHRGRI